METGFPSPAQGYEDKQIDLNRLLITHPAATIFMRMDTNQYTSMGIYNGDLLVVDRSILVNRHPVKLQQRQYVIYEQYGEFRLGKTDELLQNNSSLEICGVVTYVIHKVKNSG